MARVVGWSVEVEVAAISRVLSVEAGGVDGRLVRASERASGGGATIAREVRCCGVAMCSAGGSMLENCSTWKGELG